MKHNKVLVLMVAVVCMLLYFTSCNDAGPTVEPPFDNTMQNNQGSIPENNQGNTPDNGEDSTPDSNQDETDGQRITQNQIYECVKSYSDGLAFIRLDQASSPLYCIDKTGKIVFTLEGYGVTCGFHNGYALLQDTANNRHVLCDKQGNITTFDEFGGGSFMDKDYYTEMFADGYILLKKTETSFTGSTDYIAVLTYKNGKWEKTTDFSDQLGSDYDKVGGKNGTQYYNGYLYMSTLDRYFDLKAGVICEGMKDLYADMVLKNKSDFWEKNSDTYDDYIYDSRKAWLTDDWFPENEPIIDLKQYSETLSLVTGYKDGTCIVTFCSGSKNYLTFMDEEGNFLFEPVEATTYFGSYPSPRFYQENGTVTVVSGYNQTIIETFNTSGKIAEMAISGSYSIYVSDGVIVISTYVEELKDTYFTFYTLDMQPLF